MAVPPLTAITHPAFGTRLPGVSGIARDATPAIGRRPLLRHGVTVLAIFAASRILIDAIVWMALALLPIHVPVLAL